MFKLRWSPCILGALIGGLLSSASATADVLKLYNWEDYTSPDLIAKFEQETGITVELTTYASNEELMQTLESGSAQFDIVVPSHNFISRLADKGLLRAVNITKMSNFTNVHPTLVQAPWDPRAVYGVPFHWGTTSFMYRSDLHDGTGASLQELFEPIGSARGNIQMFEAPEEVINLASIYLGLPFCTESRDHAKMLYKLLKRQKASVKDYNSHKMSDNLASGQVSVSMGWNGYAFRGRTEKNPEIRYAFPREGVLGWVDLLAIPTGAPNVDSAKAFMNFMMAPTNSAISVNFTGYASPVLGAEKFMKSFMQSAAEILAPQVPVHYAPACGISSQRLIDQIWLALKN